MNSGRKPETVGPSIVDVYLRNATTPEFYQNIPESVLKKPAPPPKVLPNRRGRRLSYIGLTKQRAGEMYRKGLRAAIGVRKLQLAAGRAEVRKKHMPFHTGADVNHVDKHHNRIERGV